MRMLHNRAVCAMCVFAAAAAAGCKPRSNTYAAPPAPEVTVAHPVIRPVTEYIESTGTTEAFQTVDLRARVPGFLEQVNFKPGAEVKTGDLLFVIDPRTYQAAVDRAQAQLLADEAAYTAAESDAAIAEQLAAQRAGSEIDRITKAGRRDAARASVEAARAELTAAQLNLEFTQVRAPIDGRITKNYVDVGNLVGAAESTVLATIVADQPLYVTVDASERDAMTVRRMRMAQSPNAEPGEINPGEWRPVDLATADSDSFDIQGHIDYVDPALDPDTGTIRVRCRFENENGLLLPGMFVRLRFLLRTSEALVVPDTALLSDQIGRYALVVNDQDKVEMRRVEIGPIDGEARVVISGLAPEDRVIVNGLQRARSGMAVNPIEAETPTTEQHEGAGV